MAERRMAPPRRSRGSARRRTGSRLRPPGFMRASSTRWSSARAGAAAPRRRGAAPGRAPGPRRAADTSPPARAPPTPRAPASDPAAGRCGASRSTPLTATASAERARSSTPSSETRSRTSSTPPGRSASRRRGSRARGSTWWSVAIEAMQSKRSEGKGQVVTSASSNSRFARCGSRAACDADHLGREVESEDALGAVRRARGRRRPRRSRSRGFRRRGGERGRAGSGDGDGCGPRRRRAAARGDRSPLEPAEPSGPTSVPAWINLRRPRFPRLPSHPLLRGMPQREWPPSRWASTPPATSSAARTARPAGGIAGTPDGMSNPSTRPGSLLKARTDGAPPRT